MAETRARRAIRQAVEARGYTVRDLEWEPWGRAAEKEGIPGGWSLRVEPDPSGPESSGLDWFGGLSWQETVGMIDSFLPQREPGPQSGEEVC